MYEWVRARICMYVYVSVVCVYMYENMYVSVFVYVSIYICVSVYVCAYVCMHVNVSVCMHV